MERGEGEGVAVGLSWCAIASVDCERETCEREGARDGSGGCGRRCGRWIDWVPRCGASASSEAGRGGQAQPAGPDTGLASSEPLIHPKCRPQQLPTLTPPLR